MRSVGVIACSVFICAVAIFTSADLRAEPPPTVEPSTAQKRLNRRAFQAAADGNTERAIQLFVKSLAEGELNVTWLNLGRAHHREAHCEQAWAAYAKVADAPRVTTPPPEQVFGRLERYVEELAEDCPRPEGLVLVAGEPSERSETESSEPRTPEPEEESLAEVSPEEPSDEAHPPPFSPEPHVLWRPWDPPTVLVQIPATILFAVGIGVTAAIIAGEAGASEDGQALALALATPTAATGAAMLGGLIFGGTGKLHWTALGAFATAFVGILVVELAQLEESSLAVFFPLTVAGAIVSYHLSARPRISEFGAVLYQTEQGRWVFGLRGTF